MKEKVKRYASPILGLAGALVVLLGFMGVPYIVLGIAEGIRGEEFAPDSIPVQAGYIITDFAKLMSALVICSSVKKNTGKHFWQTVSFKDFDILLPIMIFLLKWSFNELFDTLDGLVLSQFMEIEPNSAYFESILGVISSVICAPIFEEIIFRYGGAELSKGTYPMWIVCIANGLVFGVVHMYNIQGFINVFFTGVLFMWIYCRTGNILYSIIPHMINNALCYIPFEDIMLFGEPCYREVNGFVLGSSWWLIINGVIFIGSMVYMIKVFPKRHGENYYRNSCISQ